MSDWTYTYRIGGLMRCCLGSLDLQMAVRMEDGKDAPQEGETLRTECCNTPLIFRDGAWEWDMTRDPA